LNYLPAANIVPIPSWPMAERYIYIPAVGLCLVAGECFGQIYSKHSVKKAVWIGTCIIVIALTALTVKRSQEWKDDVSLFASTIKTDPSSAEGHFNLGNALMDRGDWVGAKLEWEKVLQVDSVHSGALTQIGTLLATQGDFRQAEQHYNAALRSDSRNAMAYYNLGKLYEMQGNPRKAIEQYELSLSYIDATYAEYTQEIERRVAQLRKKVVK
jgi:tetratricopeptide (TPR) repeat protein